MYMARKSVNWSIRGRTEQAPFRVSASLVWQQSNLFTYTLLDSLSSLQKCTSLISPEHNNTELRNAYHVLTSTWGQHMHTSQGESNMVWNGGDLHPEYKYYTLPMCTNVTVHLLTTCMCVWCFYAYIFVNTWTNLVNLNTYCLNRKL